MEKYLNILVIDDNPKNIQVVANIIKEAYNYKLFFATNGRQALERVNERDFDLILLDIIMQPMDGFEVCRHLKDNPSTRDIPVIFLTAKTDVESLVKGFELGGVDYITKPFRFKEVLARIRTHLELIRQKKELQDNYNHLHHLEGLRDSLVHMIVHDMRSPLMVIRGNLELAQMKMAPDTTDACISDALKGTDTLLEMIDSLLDVSRMETRRMRLNFSRIDIKTLADKVVKMAEAIKGKRTLIIRSPDGAAPLAGDARLIQRVLQNLIGNALKFTDDENGLITVCIKILTDHKVRVSVTDNGPGIPREFREKIFDKFYQVKVREQVKAPPHSTGLGLTFCKLAVEAHGGRIGVGNAENGGSRFWFELPQNQDAYISHSQVQKQAR